MVKYFTPAVRRLATEHDVDISTVLGTGKGGRVTKKRFVNVRPGKTQSTSCTTTTATY